MKDKTVKHVLNKTSMTLGKTQTNGNKWKLVCI